MSYLFFSIKQVLSKPRYIFIFISTFIFVISLAIWLPNINFLSHTATSSIFTLSEKAGIISSVFGSFKTSFTPLSQFTTILIAFLFAINISLFIYYFLRAAKLSKEAGIGTVGFIIGVIALGCASCGSIILTSLLGIGVTAAFIGVLPLKGAEFGLLSIILLSISIYFLSKKINDPIVCFAKPASFKSIFKTIPVWVKVVAFVFLAFSLGVFITNKSLNGEIISSR